MVCRFMDSFDYYASAEVSRKYTSTLPSLSFIQSGTVRNGPNAIHIQSSATDHFRRSIEDSQATLITGFGFNTNESTARVLLIFFDSSTVQCSLRLNGDGSLEVLRDNNISVAGGLSSSGLIGVNTWYFIEMKVTIANSIGANTCKVQINGVEVINVTAAEDLQISGNATANQLGWFTALAVSTFIDDLYIFDGTGAENNDFAGDIKIVSHFPNTNGTTSNFVGSDGNSVDNYLLVDEALTDDDSTYTESLTPGEIDLYAFDNLAETPDTIFAVQINNVVKKDTTGNRTFRAVTRPVSTNFFGIGKGLSSSSYTNEEEIYDLNPELSLAWTESTFNATEFGIEVET